MKLDKTKKYIKTKMKTKNKFNLIKIKINKKECNNN